MQFCVGVCVLVREHHWIMIPYILNFIIRQRAKNMIMSNVCVNVCVCMCVCMGVTVYISPL